LFTETRSDWTVFSNFNNINKERKLKPAVKSKSDNPLSELIDDNVYNTLKKYKLLDEKAIRDYKIRQMYKEMRREMSAGEAIDKIQELFPYLQFDTIRKIVYQVSK
jgi:hypothetical protein